MNQSHTTGLGEPEIIGKQALFLPPIQGKIQKVIKQKEMGREKPEKRYRMTMELTKRALEIIQQVQDRYRLSNGQVLPKWQIISDALILYGSQKGGNNEHTDQ